MSELEDATIEKTELLLKISSLSDDIKLKDEEILKLNNSIDSTRSFCVETVVKSKTNGKDIFKHYAGITY